MTENTQELQAARDTIAEITAMAEVVIRGLQSKLDATQQMLDSYKMAAWPIGENPISMRAKLDAALGDNAVLRDLIQNIHQHYNPGSGEFDIDAAINAFLAGRRENG